MIPRTSQASLDRLARLTASYSKEHRRDIVRDLHVETMDVVPLGMPTIDRATGCGGLPRGRLIELYGPPSSGKCVRGDTIVSVRKSG